RFLLSCSLVHRELHSFPTRRSSDLVGIGDGHSYVEPVQSLCVPGTQRAVSEQVDVVHPTGQPMLDHLVHLATDDETGDVIADPRSEEHTSELQSRFDLVCRLLLEKK